MGLAGSQMNDEFLQIFLLLALGWVGATIGSFLNVVIYRVPLNLSVNEPKRSFCPKCKNQLKVWQNLPLISWLLLRGKCHFCKESIPSRYFWVELLTAALFVAVGWYHGPVAEHPVLIVALCLWMALLVPIVFIDLEHMIIPLSLSLSGMLVGLLTGLWVPEWLGETTWSGGLIDAAIGASAGFFGIWLVVELGKKAFGRRKIEIPEGGKWHLREPETDDDELQFIIEEEVMNWSDLFSRPSDRLLLNGGSLTVDGKSKGQQDVQLFYDRVIFGKKELTIESLKSLSGTAKDVVIPREAMGMGDAYLMGMIGALLGWEAVLFTLFVGSLCGIVVAVMGRLGFGSQIPFGPCLAIGALVWIFGGSQLWELYLSLPQQWNADMATFSAFSKR